MMSEFIFLFFFEATTTWDPWVKEKMHIYFLLDTAKFYSKRVVPVVYLPEMHLSVSSLSGQKMSHFLIFLNFMCEK